MTWLCSQVISGNSFSVSSRERRPTGAIWSSPTSKLRTIMYLGMATSLTSRVRAEKGSQLPPVDLHVRVLPVGVRLVRPRSVQLLVVRAREALVVPDHVPDPDVEAIDEPRRQLERGADLRSVAEDLAVGRAHVLDADRDVVEPDGVAAHDVQAHELVDRPVVAHDEVDARTRKLAELRVGRVPGEAVPRRGEAVAAGVVLDDHLRVEAPRVDAVVLLGVRGHLGLPPRAVRDRLPDDVRLRRDRERDREGERGKHGTAG